MILKLLGAIDLAAALAFLMMIFGIQPFAQFLLFCCGLLFVKGLFAFTGDVLSFVDLFAAAFLLIAVFLTLPAVFLWTFSFLLIAKGVVSFF